MMPLAQSRALPIEWQDSQQLVDYAQAIEAMERRVGDITAGKASELVWLLEHPPLYTAGTSAQNSDLLEARFPVYKSGRGGQFTYHGPGQRIAYVMLNLKQRGEMDIRAYVKSLERWLIATLAQFGIEAFTREDRIGVWVAHKSGECKIAALGIRVRQWVTYHGISLNVSPDLSHYAGIIPCGISEHGVTSLKALGMNVSMEEVDIVLKQEFLRLFT
jgi:lipoyl(octanoyl) transferase